MENPAYILGGLQAIHHYQNMLIAEHSITHNHGPRRPIVGHLVDAQLADGTLTLSEGQELRTPSCCG